MIDIDTELRKLRPAELYNLGLILNPSDNWKKLMASVTKEGSDNIPKFPGEYISIVEQAARQERKLAAAIFLEEWATMGKKRPTVGLLLELLMKNELFRAADYLAQDILKVAAPQRPASGPAAPVDIDEIAEKLLRQNLQSASSSKISDFCKRTTNEIRLSQINYPSSVFDSTNDDNLAIDQNEVGVIEMKYAESRSNQVFEAGRILNNEKSSNNYNQCHEEAINKNESKSSKEISDLIKFSANDNENLNKYSQSDLLKFDTEKIDPEEKIDICDAVIPNLSLLRINSSSKDDLKENTNYAQAINAELTSAELPACIGRFGRSDESSANVDNYFHRELISAELPLCINNGIGFNSKEANSSVLSSETIDNQSSESIDNQSSESIDNQSSKSLEIENKKNMDSSLNIPCFVVEAGTNKQNEEKQENVENETGKDVLNSMELPITVLEFHNR